MRYERKFKIHHTQHHLVLQSIRVHPAGLRKIYPDRQVNNIYFDTPTLQTFHDNVHGIAQRNKYRVRWYGNDPKQIETPNFEIKTRINEVGTKVVIPVDAFQLGDLSKVTAAVNEHLKHSTKVQPVLLNSYHRAYYGTSDSVFRVTIDSKLQYHSLQRNRNFMHYRLQEPVVVLEIKYDVANDDALHRIAQHFPFRLSKSSKYVTGVTLSNGF